MKRSRRYDFARMYCMRVLELDPDLPIAQRVGPVMVASQRFGLSAPQTRRLVSELRQKTYGEEHSGR